LLSIVLGLRFLKKYNDGVREVYFNLFMNGNLVIGKTSGLIISGRSKLTIPD
jgi:hypothetical protein